MHQRAMISVHIGNVRFQVRAAAIVVRNDRVLLHRLQGDSFWALPGGRVEAGEDARSTLLREMAEEIGEPVECRQLLHVAENFFVHAGAQNHEIGMYFDTLLGSDSRLLDPSVSHAGVEGDHPLEFRWFTLDQLDEVDLRPSFLRDTLRRPVPQTRHIVQHA